MLGKMESVTQDMQLYSWVELMTLYGNVIIKEILKIPPCPGSGFCMFAAEIMVE